MVVEVYMLIISASRYFVATLAGHTSLSCSLKVAPVPTSSPKTSLPCSVQMLWRLHSDAVASDALIILATLNQCFAVAHYWLLMFRLAKLAPVLLSTHLAAAAVSYPQTEREEVIVDCCDKSRGQSPFFAW